MEKLFSRKEAADLLGISLATLDAARADGLISYVQYVENGCVFFTNIQNQKERIPMTDSTSCCRVTIHMLHDN